MAYISVESLPDIAEDVDIDVTFSANANTGVISSVTASLDTAITGNVVVTVGTPSGTNGNTVITISGRYNDNFDKTITYENGEYVTNVVARWKDVESGYNFITEYVAAGGGTSTATYTVTVDGTPFTVTQAINNSSYTPGQNYLIQYVAQGKY